MRQKLVTYKGIQQVSKYTEDNESRAPHGEGSYTHRKGEGENTFCDIRLEQGLLVRIHGF